MHIIDQRVSACAGQPDEHYFAGARLAALCQQQGDQEKCLKRGQQEYDGRDRSSFFHKPTMLLRPGSGFPEGWGMIIASVEHE